MPCRCWSRRASPAHVATTLACVSMFWSSMSRISDRSRLLIVRLVDSASKVPGLQCWSIGLCSTRWSGISGWEEVGKTTGMSLTERLMSTGGCFMAKSVICPESIDSSGSISQRGGSLSNWFFGCFGLWLGCCMVVGRLGDASYL